MGIFSIFGNRKNEEAAEQELEQIKSEQKARAVEEAKKAHEDMEWPVIGRINPINTKDAGDDRIEGTYISFDHSGSVQQEGSASGI